LRLHCLLFLCSTRLINMLGASNVLRLFLLTDLRPTMIHHRAPVPHPDTPVGVIKAQVLIAAFDDVGIFPTPEIFSLGCTEKGELGLVAAPSLSLEILANTLHQDGQQSARAWNACTLTCDT
ncbi:hypothetical protein BXZ70DRAFT_964494, partial [Cristinia sonorae]